MGVDCRTLLNGIPSMKVSIIYISLLLFLGLSLAFRLDELQQSFLLERQDASDQLLPAFIATFIVSSLVNSLSYISLPTAAVTTTTTTTTVAPGMTTTTTTTTPAEGMTTTTTTTTAPASGCKCGIEGSGNRIVGGSEVSPINKYPWLVRLFNSDETGSFCGGTLVASKYVISAAHCMFELDDSGTVTAATEASQIKIRIGDHNLETTGETKLPEKFINVKKITNHPEYKQEIGQQSVVADGHDITILELETEVDLDVYTPACLAKTTDATTFDGQTATVAGWGNIQEGGPAPNPLVPHEVDVPVIAADQCTYSNEDPSELCAGFRTGEKDACQGDSGGPLTYKANNQHILIGDVSHGQGCARPNEYGVYCRISNVRAWIDSTMTSPKFCPNGGANASSRYRHKIKQQRKKQKKKNKKKSG